MTYQSEFYNLSRPGKGWSKGEFAFAVERLETMARVDLVALCRMPKIQLSFTDYTPPKHWEEETPAEEIISALLADYPPEILLPAIRSFA